MHSLISGPAWVYGDNVDTDVIIPARYLSLTESADLAPHCLEDIDPSFAREAEPGAIIVGGFNFGAGSSREQAPNSFLGKRVAAIVAAGFATIFYRNAINVGLPILECPEIRGNVEKGDMIEIETSSGTIRNLTTERSFASQPFPPFLVDLINVGGLVPYTRKKLGLMRD